MEGLLVYGVFVLIGAVLLRGLIPSQSQPPQVVYVQVEPVQQSVGLGCLPILIVGLLIAFMLFAAA